MSTVAALYVDPRGPYPKLEAVDCWDEARDARKYDGPYPVVAHPPCKTWSKLQHLSKLPDDGGMFRKALLAVRKYGGVIEHPAGSKAFDRYELPKPGDAPDVCGGITIEVCQVEWGHVARKRTWLYLCGGAQSGIDAPPFPGRKPTHWASGGRRHARKGSGGFAPEGMKICSAQQRNRTPELFAAYLVRLARNVSVKAGAA